MQSLSITVSYHSICIIYVLYVTPKLSFLQRYISTWVYVCMNNLVAYRQNFSFHVYQEVEIGVSRRRRRYFQLQKWKNRSTRSTCYDHFVIKTQTINYRQSDVGLLHALRTYCRDTFAGCMEFLERTYFSCISTPNTCAKILECD